jgi:hypothetical protein
LLGLSQAVEVVQHTGAGLAVLEVELPSAAEFTDEQQQAIPQQKAALVGDPLLATRVRDPIEPGCEEKVSGGRPTARRKT